MEPQVITPERVLPLEEFALVPQSIFYDDADGITTYVATPEVLSKVQWVESMFSRESTTALKPLQTGYSKDKTFPSWFRERPYDLSGPQKGDAFLDVYGSSVLTTTGIETLLNVLTDLSAEKLVFYKGLLSAEIRRNRTRAGYEVLMRSYALKLINSVLLQMSGKDAVLAEEHLDLSQTMSFPRIRDEPLDISIGKDFPYSSFMSKMPYRNLDLYVAPALRPTFRGIHATLNDKAVLTELGKYTSWWSWARGGGWGRPPRSGASSTPSRTSSGPPRGCSPRTP